MTRKEYQRQYYLTHKEKYIPDPEKKRINDLKYQEKNREKILEARRQWRIDNYEKDLFFQVRKRSRHANLPFDLDVEDIVIPEYCPYLNIKLEVSHGKGWKKNSPSIDRIIPELGYTKGNVEIISMLANTMKNCATKEELVLFAKEILRRYND